MIRICIVDGLLLYHCVEVRIPQLDRYAAGKFVLLAQLKPDGFRHTHQLRMEEVYIDSVRFECSLRGNRSLLAVRYDRRFIQSVGLSPDVDAILSQQRLHHLYRYLTQGADRLHATPVKL